MAIGDAVVFELGAGAESHQPASGVEERISAVVKDEVVDLTVFDNGTLAKQLWVAAVKSARLLSDAAGAIEPMYSMNLVISNGFFISKQGTTDVVAFSGVQTNA